MVICSNCRKEVESLCASCWRCDKCCDCKNKTGRRIDGSVGFKKKPK